MNETLHTQHDTTLQTVLYIYQKIVQLTIEQ